MNDLCFIYWFTYRIQIAWAFGSMLMPLRHRPDAKVSDRCLIGVEPMVLAIWGYIICLNFLMCVFNLFSFHQPPVYNHPSPIIQSPNSLLANVFCLQRVRLKIKFILSYLVLFEMRIQPIGMGLLSLCTRNQSASIVLQMRAGGFSHIKVSFRNYFPFETQH